MAKAATLSLPFLLTLTLSSCALIGEARDGLKSDTPAGGPIQQFEALLDSVSLMSLQLQRLERLYNQARASSTLVPFSEQFSEAQEAYIQQDYTKSVTLLDPIIRDAVNRSEALFPAALYYIADSHYHLDNLDLSRIYFEDLLRLPRGDYQQQSLEKLALIAKERRVWTPLKGYVSALTNLDTLSPGARYAVGFGLLRLKYYERALDAFADYPDSEPLYMRVLYLRSVAHVQLRQFEEAQELIQEIRLQIGQDPNQSDLADLATLTDARIRFELDDLAGAAEAYQSIPRESPHFGESVYELAHTYARRADIATNVQDKRRHYERALATLELVFILDDQESTIAETLMLKASIMTRIGKVDEAKLTLAQMLERYDPLSRYMDDLPQRIEALTDYYDLLAPGFSTKAIDLPPMVAEYLDAGPKLKRARLLISDLDNMNRAIRYLVRNTRDLETNLRLDPKGYFLPSGQRAFERVDKLEQAFDQASTQLIDISQQIVRPYLNAEEQLESDIQFQRYANARIEFEILKGSERALIKSLSRKNSQENFKLIKDPQKKITESVSKSRREYESESRSFKKFLRSFYKRLAQSPGSGSKNEAVLDKKLQELKAQRSQYNRSLIRNRNIQEDIIQSISYDSWSVVAEQAKVKTVLEYLERHPNILPTQTQLWLFEKLKQRQIYLDTDDIESNPQERKSQINKGANLLLHGLRILESGIRQQFLKTYDLERTFQLTLVSSGGKQSQGLWLALGLERAGKLLSQLRARSKNLETKIRRHIDARLATMRRQLTLESSTLKNQSSALGLAEAKTRRLVDMLAVDALAELRVYLRELLVRTEVAQLEILWEEKIREVNKIDELLKEQREAVQAVEQRFRHVFPNN